jgi:predicted amidohydrolase
MKALVFGLMVSGALLASGPLFEQSTFSGKQDGWKAWAARAEIAPETFVDAKHSRGEGGALAISGNGNPAAYGGWQREVDGIQPGHWYRLTAHYRVEGATYEPLQVLSRLDWRAGQKRTGQPDYGYQTTVEGDWKRVVLEAPAPSGATGVTLELYLGNAPKATVWWDDIRLEEMAAPSPRPVTVASINLRPAKTKSAAENVGLFLDAIEKTVKQKADIILLPEGITVVGNGQKYVDVAESIPGPTTERLGECARRKNAWIAAGIYERDGVAVYNTAVLIDRSGKVAGKYRKVYLPREEIEAGLTPGSSYPVFQTDFGKIGMMICYDQMFADPARALALQGAELILLPIWGGNLALGKARAVENRVFIAASGYDYPTYVRDPDGEILAQAHDRGQAAIATIDLNRRYPDKWLGDMKNRVPKELRLDVKYDRPGFTR